jgi:hypothetical protein
MGVKTIQFQTKEASIKFIGLSNREKWPWDYLGNDTFVLTEEQVTTLEQVGIPFTEVKPTPVPK